MALQLEEMEYANEAFYLAFEGKDYAAMAHLWSATREIVCLHPGWPALVGRDVVMESWRRILSNPEQGQVSVYGARCEVLAADVGVVVCYETAGNAVMVATNVFAQETAGLKLVSHHAGVCASPPQLGGE